jgi:hypothetical protein
MKKLIILSFCLISVLSCTKEKFSGTQSFWYDEDTANDLVAFGITDVSMYVDGTLLSTGDAYDHFVKDPGCGSGNFIFIDSKMFKKENKTHSYKVYDQLDSLIWEGVFQMSQGKCNSLQLKR